MKRTRCAKLAPTIIRRLQALLGLQHWRIDLVIGKCSELGTQAEVSILHEYCRGHLTVDPDTITDPRELLTVLSHELLHLALSNLEAWSVQLDAALAEEAALRRTLQVSLIQCVERSVVQLESAIVGLYVLTHGEPE